MGRFSAQKGSRFERLICQELSLLISGPDNPSKDWFRRSVLSGGLHTGLQAGDIAAAEERAHWFTDLFVVECKHSKKSLLASSIYEGTGIVYRWWDKLTSECRKLRRIPLLIMRENNRPVLLCTNNAGRQVLEMAEVGVDVHITATDMHICRFDVFVAFGQRSVEAMRTMYQRKKGNQK